MGFLKTLGSIASSVGGAALNGVTGGLSSAVGSGISSLIGGGSSSADALASSKELAKYQASLNKEAFDYESAWNAAQTDKANTYNSMVQQVQRMRDAGYNPANMFGSGNATVAATPARTGSLQAANVAQAQASVVAAKQQSLNEQLALSQIANTNAQTEKIKSETSKVGAETTGILSQNEFIEALNNNTLRLGNSTLSLNDSQRTKLSADTEVSYQTYKNLQNTYDQISSQINSINADVSLKNSQELLNSLEAKFKPQLFNAQLAQINSSIKLNDSQISKIHQDVLNAIKTGESIDLNNVILGMQPASVAADIKSKSLSNEQNEIYNSKLRSKYTPNVVESALGQNISTLGAMENILECVGSLLNGAIKFAK